MAVTEPRPTGTRTTSIAFSSRKPQTILRLVAKGASSSTPHSE